MEAEKSLDENEMSLVVLFLFSLFLFLSYLALNDLEEMTLIYLNVLFLFFININFPPTFQTEHNNNR